MSALIQTKKTKDGAFELYDINDVIIPERYKTCNFCDEYKKFEDLPKKLRKTLHNRYQQQKSLSLSCQR